MHNSTALFLINDLAALRAKINGLDGPLALLWSDMRRLVRNRPDVAWMLAPFVATVTGDAADIEIARHEMLAYCRRLPGRSLSIDVQQDFWCPSFQVARMAIYYSWLRELGSIAGADAAECEQNLLDYAFAHMYTSGLTKHHTDTANNQTLSLSFGCTVIGHLLGYRLNTSPTARLIMAEGLKHLRLRVSSMPRGGWSGEGSTYQVQVVGPGVSLACMVLEAVTGTDVFFRRENAEFATPAEVAEMAHRCALPDGLMLPWDNYGFFLSQITLTSAVLARKTGDAAYLNWVPAARLTKPYVHFGWGRDEKVLTLLFWPENARASTPRAFPGWSAETVGAQYVSPDERVSFFQMCDEHGAGPEVGRPECNPNHVVYGAFGAQLFPDGRAANGQVFHFAGCQKQVARITGPAEINWSCGGPGAHSCLLIDGREEYIPTRRAHGRVTTFADLGDAALLATESAASYQPTFDVTSVRRTSALLAGGRVVVIRDQVAAATPHRYQSRFYLRPAAHQLPARDGFPCFVVDTPERVRFHLFALDACTVARKELIGFPAVFEGRSAVLDFHHGAAGKASIFTLLIVAEDQVEPLTDVTEGWAVWGGPSLAEQNPRGVTAALDAYLTAWDELKTDRVVTLRKTLPLNTAVAQRELCLRLPRGLRKCPVLVNGQQVATALPEQFRPAQDAPGDIRPAADLLHPWVTLKAAGERGSQSCEVAVVFERTAGSNHLYSDLLANAFPHGNGPATLGAVYPEALSPQVNFSEGRLTVTGIRGEAVTADLAAMGDGRLICEHRTESSGSGSLPPAGPSRSGHMGFVGTTELDAKSSGSGSLPLAGPSRSGYFGAANSTYLGCRAQPGVFQASRPLRLGLTVDTIRLGTLEAPFLLAIERYDAPIEIDWHAGTLQVAYRGAEPLTLTFAAPDLQAVLVNGVLTPAEGQAERVVRLSGAVAAASPYAQDAALSRCWSAGHEAATAAELVALLGHADWQVCMAAAVTLGERREAKAREVLIACLDGERDEAIFENKKEYCWFVRGNADAFDGDKTPIRRADDPTRFAAWSRRWRLKGQIARALGRIGGPGAEDAVLASIADGQDFHYYVCACQALRDCGTEKSLPALGKFLVYEEVCTQRYAQDAIDAIKIRGAS